MEVGYETENFWISRLFTGIATELHEFEWKWKKVDFLGSTSIIIADKDITTQEKGFKYPWEEIPVNIRPTGVVPGPGGIALLSRKY